MGEFKIEESCWLAPAVRRLVVEAPRIVRRAQPGQFVIIRVATDGERIPLTIAHVDRAAGTILLIVQAVGATTHQICALEAGQALCDVAGPLGRPTEIEKLGHVVVVGGGVGTAVVYPQARALRDAGNHTLAIIGGRTRPYVILEEELKQVCDAVYPCTDDGSYGFHGFVTQRLQKLLEEEPRIGAVYTAGPVPMMRAVAEVTRPRKLKTIASLNPIMVDGTGMCGGCRIQVDGQMRFACVDGPEFDAHQVDFNELTARLATYRPQEQVAMERRACRAEI